MSKDGGMSIRIAILISGRHGRGSNMQAIVDACRDGRIDGEIVLVIGNYDSPALDRAREQGLPTVRVASPKPDAAPEAQSAYGAALLAALEPVRPDLICLAGYLLKVPDGVLTRFPGRIMNIHNGLLPAFGGQGMYGGRVHQAVLDYGAKISGCTVHFIDQTYDTGPVILQTAVPVLEDDTADTLAARVLVAEHDTYWRAVALFAAGRLRMEGRRVRILAGVTIQS
jgi:formyltetrahydrofolate-dependent phosphoribosylglycinamide formyltransferase